MSTSQVLSVIIFFFIFLYPHKGQLGVVIEFTFGLETCTKTVCHQASQAGASDTKFHYQTGQGHNHVFTTQDCLVANLAWPVAP